MKTIFSQDHILHQPQHELDGGVFVPPYEKPSRMDFILAALKKQGFETPIAPQAVDMASINQIHNPDYITFLETVWQEWTTAGESGEVIANIVPARRMEQNRPPQSIVGKVGHYAMASETSITKTTLSAALSSAACAQSAAGLINSGEDSAFALCRPPGHHASLDQFGGYCFLNNAAIAAQELLNSGVKKLAILDVDFHHGNGTQDIFYSRNDVFFASLHGHPENEFPYFLGWADETGSGAGDGCNLNIPYRPGTDFAKWSEGLTHALGQIRDFGAETLIISLGVDTYENDPISSFKFTSNDFQKLGAMIAREGLQTLFVMEGGYAVEEIGINTVNTLLGFEGG